MEDNEITGKIIGVFYDVYNRLGSGFLEKVYENAMKIEFKKNGLKFKSQYPIKVFYDNNIVGDYIADFLIEDKIIVEIKAKKEYSDIDCAQIINYLVSTKKKIGLLFNYGVRPQKKRFVNNFNINKRQL